MRKLLITVVAALALASGASAALVPNAMVDIGGGGGCIVGNSTTQGYHVWENGRFVGHYQRLVCYPWGWEVVERWTT